MCLYSTIRFNPKYKANKKNGGIIPPLYDQRVLGVPTGCGKCMECRKQKSREWQVRLTEDIKYNTNGKMVTFTFSNESIKKIINDLEEDRKKHNNKILSYYADNMDEYMDKQLFIYDKREGYELDNAIANKGIRMFLERMRKITKKYERHWFITELGHNGTENIHIHGIIWTNETYDTIRNKWQYGWIYPRSKEQEKKCYVNARTVNYMTKYITKQDKKHPNYIPIILSSNGMGIQYINTLNATKNQFNGKDTNQMYRLDNGTKIPLPKYWKNKIYTEEEKEKLWINMLDKEERYINGERVSIKHGTEEYYKLLKFHREINKQMGYTSNANWKQQEYEHQRRTLLQQQRIQNTSSKA